MAQEWFYACTLAHLMPSDFASCRLRFDACLFICWLCSWSKWANVNIRGSQGCGLVHPSLASSLPYRIPSFWLSRKLVVYVLSWVSSMSMSSKFSWLFYAFRISTLTVADSSVILSGSRGSWLMSHTVHCTSIFALSSNPTVSHPSSSLATSSWTWPSARR